MNTKFIFPCSIGIIIEDGKHSNITFKGAKLYYSTWEKHKFFHPDEHTKEEVGLWVEVKCNREDEHPMNGKHWYKCDGFVIEWEIPEDAIWMA